jgi:tetratricopeptide (TPR) repeat protein
MAEQNLEQSIFLHAIGLAPADRAAYLDEACRDNPQLRAELDALLAAHDRLGGVPPPSIQPDATGAFTPPTETPGAVVGPYKLLEQIGEGGMGTVWMAQQTEPVKRLVALKVIKPGMDSRQVIARFEAERQALALMEHPHIARVLDAGTTKGEPGGVSPGRPYFVMELVKGVPLTKYCDEHRLTPKQRLELFIPVCQAIQHAHQKGIIHRDIKPSNVLVALYDGKPVPKVIDFGIAKAAGQRLTEHTLVTGFGTVVGTLEYMSPEQAELNQLDIDTRSDIYSLGVVLYELLTGSTPLEKKRLKQAAMLEVLRIIREEEPPRPSTRLSTTEELPSVAANRGLEPKKLSGVVRGELDWIVMKALEKDRNRRYETANGFAADVQRYLSDEPVQACPPSAWYRFRKFARRNKTGLAVASLILFVIALLGGGGGWVLRDRAAREQQAAKERQDREQRLTAQVELILADVDRLEREQKWPEAQAAAGRAEAALAGGEADETVRQRVQDARRDLAFVAELDRIRQEQATWGEGKPKYATRAVRDYARAFREYGVDVEALPAGEVVARLRAKPALAVALAVALDDWVNFQRGLGEGAPSWKPLVTLARGLDPDPFRDRLRATWGRPVTRELQAELLGLAEAVNIKKQGPATLYLMGLILSRAQLVDAAVRTFRAGQYAYSEDFWLNFGLGYVLLSEQKDYAGAAQYFSAAVSLRPRSAPARTNLGNALYNQKKLDESIGCFRKAIELDPTNAIPLYNLGNVLAAQRKLDEAIACYRKAIDLDPNYAAAHDALGTALRDKKQLDEAIREYRKAIGLDPKWASAHNNLGTALSAQGKLDEAIAEYRTAVKLDPQDAMPHGNLGNTLREQGKLDEAVAACRHAIELDPKSASAHNNLGAALYEQRKLNLAVTALRKAIELNPKLAPPYGNLGKVLRNQKKLEEAVTALRKAIELDPTDARFHLSLGDVLHKQGKLKEAIAESRKAIALDPKHAHAHNILGVCLGKHGKVDEAIAEFRQAITLDPKYAEAHCNLGVVLGAQKKLQAAISCFRTAVKLDPKYALAHCYLGQDLWQQGKPDEAFICFKKAVLVDPTDARFHLELGAFLCDHKHDYDGAIAEYRKAITLDPTWAPPHYGLGIVRRAKGDLEGAIVEFRKAITLKPDYAEAHCNLAIALKLKGEFREGLKEMRRGHEFGSKNPGWKYPSAEWLRQCERLVELDRKLPGFLDGKTSPAGSTEWIELAQLCSCKRLNRAVARFYEGAFRTEPKLADDLGAGNRYNAACAAALAGCGVGKDADKLDEKEKARLRGQALGWLRADLLLCAKQLASGKPADRADVQAGLRHWLVDADLAGVRGSDALGKLPEAERQSWQRLWQDVEGLLKRAEGKPVPEKK